MINSLYGPTLELRDICFMHFIPGEADDVIHYQLVEALVKDPDVTYEAMSYVGENSRLAYYIIYTLIALY